MIYTKVPKERIAVIIGKEGAVLKELKKRSGAEINIDSETGEVEVKAETAEDPVLGLKAADVVKAIARGFSPERAYRLLRDNEYLTFLDIHDFAGKSQKRIRQVRARIIGRKGKTRSLIEDLTGAEISVYGTTVGIIGDTIENDIAVRAVTMLLEGSEHSTVYRFLEHQRQNLKVAHMGFEYYERKD